MMDLRRIKQKGRAKQIIKHQTKKLAKIDLLRMDIGSARFDVNMEVRRESVKNDAVVAIDGLHGFHLHHHFLRQLFRHRLPQRERERERGEEKELVLCLMLYSKIVGFCR